MAKKEFTYRGKNLEELKALTVNEVAELFPARARRSLKKGLTDGHKKVLSKIAKGDKNIKTHCRNMIILPVMVDHIVKVHNGREFVNVAIQPEMIGHLLGEFSPSRKSITHSSPGVGATRSSSNISVK